MTGTWGGLGGLSENEDRAPLLCSDLLGVKVSRVKTLPSHT